MNFIAEINKAGIIGHVVFTIKLNSYSLYMYIKHPCLCAWLGFYCGWGAILEDWKNFFQSGGYLYFLMVATRFDGPYRLPTLHGPLIRYPQFARKQLEVASRGKWPGQQFRYLFVSMVMVADGIGRSILEPPSYLFIDWNEIKPLRDFNNSKGKSNGFPVEIITVRIIRVLKELSSLNTRIN